MLRDPDPADAVGRRHPGARGAVPRDEGAEAARQAVPGAALQPQVHHGLQDPGAGFGRVAKLSTGDFLNLSLSICQYVITDGIILVRFFYINLSAL